MPDKFNKGILDSLRIGIAKIETGGSKDPYNQTAGDKNKDGKPDSTALGKYQFLKSYWWDKPGKIMSIKEFAKSKNGAFGKIEKWEDFGKSPELQEEYFNYYAENFLIPEAKKAISKGNPLGLTLDQAAAVIHKDGSGAGSKAITTGKLPGETGTNVSSSKYLNVFNNAIEDAGLKNYTLAEYVNNKIKVSEASGENPNLTPEEKKERKSAEDRIADYRRRNEAINKMGAEVSTKENLRKKLWQEIVNNDDADLYNEAVEKENAANKNSREEKVQDLRDLVSMAQKMEIFYREGDDKQKRKFEESGYFDSDDKDDKELYNRLKKKYPKFFAKGKEYNFKHRVKQKELFDEIESQYKDLSGKKLDITPGYTGAGKVGTLNSDFWGNFTSKLFGNSTRTGSLNIAESDFDIPSFKPEQKIDTSEFQKQKPQVDQTAEKPTPEMGEVVHHPSESKKEAQNTDANGVALGTAEDLLRQRKNVVQNLQSKDMNYQSGARQLPINAVAGLALGLTGMNKADNELPLRKEDVGQAVKNYAAELAKISKMGLSPAQEANLKSQLSEAYQGGLENIVNASAGNRALVLGNQGQLESAKVKGLAAIGEADHRAKMSALEKYGNVAMYMDEVRRNKEIANHQIQYSEALQERQDGQQLAAAGFSQMINELQYQRENGPGSANDMYRSYLMQKMFGYDPKMKDDGTGKPGTKSAYDAKQANEKEQLGLATTYLEKIKTLNPDQKKVVDRVALNYGDAQSIHGTIDYLKENPDADLSNFSLDNMDIAQKTNDYSVLAMTRREAMGETASPVSEIKPETPSLATPGFNASALAGIPNPSPAEAIIEKKENTDPYQDQVAMMQNYYNQQ